jgi:ketosteroid isomerase-like protein
MSAPRNPAAVVEALHAAFNARDIEALVALFADDYDSVQPAHPDRAFAGAAQVRKNWSTVFDGVPDLRSELVDSAVDGDTAWSEWRWRGTHTDGSAMDMVGVIVLGIRDGRIATGRLFMEPVEQHGPGIDAQARRMAGRDA